MVDVSRYFSIQIFFIILRETLETAIIISVLLSFINKREPPSVEDQDTEPSCIDEAQAAKNAQIRKINQGLRLQVWLGAILGLAICFVIGLVFIGCFYFIETDLWSYTERLWEGIFSLLSSIIITIMGVGLLRINKVMKIKWWIKLGDAYANENHGKVLADGEPEGAGQGAGPEGEGAEQGGREGSGGRGGLLGRGGRGGREKFSKKYFLAILPFVTTLREGLEAVVFIGGIGMSQPLSSLPLAVLCGVLLGAGIGLSLYKGGNKMSLQYFLICSTCFLYVVSAGLMSRGVWFLELEQYVRRCGGLDVSETGSGPGSYDVANTIWHVNCCNGLKDGWWMVANAIVGWTNTATYGSVYSYIGYWMFVSGWLRLKMVEERNGYIPFLPIKWQLKRIRKKVRLYEMRISQGGRTDQTERAADAEVMNP